MTNTSPLIALAAALSDFTVLGEVARWIVPGEVFEGPRAGELRDDTARLVEQAAFCLLRQRFTSLPAKLTTALGRGEAAVIHTALSEGLDTVVIDERKGRRQAMQAGLHVTGSLGILLTLHRRNLTPPMGEVLARMRARSIHLSDALADECLRLAASATPDT